MIHRTLHGIFRSRRRWGQKFHVGCSFVGSLKANETVGRVDKVAGFQDQIRLDLAIIKDFAHVHDECLFVVFARGIFGCSVFAGSAFGDGGFIGGVLGDGVVGDGVFGNP